jgi:hypothetical protein
MNEVQQKKKIVATNHFASGLVETSKKPPKKKF